MPKIPYKGTWKLETPQLILGGAMDLYSRHYQKIDTRLPIYNLIPHTRRSPSGKEWRIFRGMWGKKKYMKPKLIHVQMPRPEIWTTKDMHAYPVFTIVKGQQMHLGHRIEAFKEWRKHKEPVNLPS
jgi:hypothetical protein